MLKKPRESLKKSVLLSNLRNRTKPNLRSRRTALAEIVENEAAELESIKATEEQ